MRSKKDEDLNKLDKDELLTLARRMTGAQVDRRATRSDLIRAVGQCFSVEEIRKEVRGIVRQRGTGWGRRFASRRPILGLMALIIVVSSFYVAWLGSSPNQFYLVEPWDRTVREEPSTNSVRAGAVDGTGSLYIIEVNTNSLLIKFTSSGVEEWRRNFTIVGYQLMGRPWQPSLAIDEGGRNIYAAGVCSDPATGAMEGFVAGLDWRGEVRWTHTWGAGSKAEQIAFGGGAIYAVGSTSMPGGERAFLARYDVSGSQVWNATWGGKAPARAEGVAVNHDGSVFVTGYFNASSVPSVTAYQGFLGKYGCAGGEVWNANLGADYGARLIAGGDCAYVIGGSPGGLRKHSAENGMLVWRKQLGYSRVWNDGEVTIHEYFALSAARVYADGNILVAGKYDRGELRNGSWTNSHAIPLVLLSSSGATLMNATSERQPGTMFLDTIVVGRDGGVWVVGRVYHGKPEYYWESVLMKLYLMSSFLAGTALTVSLASVACVTLAVLWKEKQANLRNSRRR